MMTVCPVTTVFPVPLAFRNALLSTSKFDAMALRIIICCAGLNTIAFSSCHFNMPTEGWIQFPACSIPVPRQLTVYHDGRTVNSWPCTSREPFVLKRHFCTSLVLSLSQLPTFILLKSPKCLHSSHSCFLLQWENKSYPQKTVSSLTHHHNCNLATQIPKWPGLSNSHESCQLLYLFITSTSFPYWRTTCQYLSPVSSITMSSISTESSHQHTNMLLFLLFKTPSLEPSSITLDIPFLCHPS